MSVIRNDLFGLPILIVEGRVDFYTCPRLLEVVLEAVEQSRAAVAVDLKQVKAIDESGLGLLDAVARCLRQRQRRLRLIGLSDAVRKALASHRPALAC